jgi:hypothetical protein
MFNFLKHEPICFKIGNMAANDRNKISSLSLIPSINIYTAAVSFTRCFFDLKNEHGFSFGSKGQIPWITLNGEDIADSQFCIDFLAKKYNKDLSASFSPKELGEARAFRQMAEQSLFW